MTGADWASLAGGVGLFLLGMILMTDGLKTAAGGALRRILSGMTRGRLYSVAAGAGMTALVQSSSATTVATIGFVSAGLLAFPEALGVIIGANIGTTSTGWIVALLGLKLQIGVIALPLVALGALARLFLEGARASLGMALAGFGVIFVGIDLLQEAMAGLAMGIDPGTFPVAAGLGRIFLLMIGAASTVVMQSSSAAVATTLTGLYAGALDLSQAAYLVIGQNVGTTVTAAIASVGGSTAARRTGTAHILFNISTGAAVFLAVPWVLPLLERWVAGGAAGDPALVIAGFHTAFNLVGAALFLPFLVPFSRLVARIVPQQGPELAQNLDRSMREMPTVAVETARRSVAQVTREANRRILRVLGKAADRRSIVTPGEVDSAIFRLREFLEGIDTSTEGPDEFQRHVDTLHALDHVERLGGAAWELDGIPDQPDLAAAADRVTDLIASVDGWLADEASGERVEGRPYARSEAVEATSVSLAKQRKESRVTILGETARGKITPEEADIRLDAMRWLDRVAYHLWRIVHHLVLAGQARPQEAPSGAPVASTLR